MYRKDIIAVIPTHYRPFYFEAALKSVIEQTVKCDVLIIDSGHHEYTKKIIQQYEDSNTIQKIIHKSIDNISPANNFHEGFKTACEMGYEWIWVMDDDAEADEKALEELLKYTFVSDGVLASTILMFYDKSINFGHRRHIKNSCLFREYNSCLDDYNDDYFECDTVSYVSLLINKEILIEVNFNNPDFFFQYDDTDLSIRIRLKDKKILNINKSRVFHGELTKLNNSEYKYSVKELYGIRNKIYIEKKYSSNLLIAICYSLYLPIRKVLATIIMRKYAGYRLERINGIFKAYIDAMREKLGKITDARGEK